MGGVGSYPLLSQAQIHIEVELGCDNMLSHFLLVTGSGTKLLIKESTQNVPHCTVMNPGVTIKASE